MIADSGTFEVVLCGGHGVDDGAVANTEWAYGRHVVEPLIDSTGSERAPQRFLGQVGNIQPCGLGFGSKIVGKVDVHSCHAHRIHTQAQINGYACIHRSQAHTAERHHVSDGGGLR